jgi:hypothetical protein
MSPSLPQAESGGILAERTQVKKLNDYNASGAADAAFFDRPLNLPPRKIPEQTQLG